MFTMRFDMRAPESSPASASDLYAAALEMASWGEENGCIAMQVSEHHASPDGYLSDPLVLAAALAARTTRTPIQVAALLVPLHDPIALAERMAVLDLVSGGRVSYICAIGYRAEEYAMFGRDLKRRGRRLDECLDVLEQAFTGEPFEYEGRPVRVTPKPATPGGPVLMLGGGSEAAIKRAARRGLGFLGQGGDPALAELYAQECEKHGTTPGPCIIPPPGAVNSAFVAEDPDRAWAELGPYLLHDAKMYGAWMGAGSNSSTLSAAASVDELRAEQGSYRIFTPDEAVAYVKQYGVLLTQPLCGGLPPELAWSSLQLVASKVIPALSS